MLPVTVLILAKNEEKNLPACIASVAFASEVIVIDDYSTDKTADIAISMGAKVVQRALDGDWGAQQTFAINQASNPWIYFLDADERVNPKLARHIAEVVKADDRRYAYNNARLSYFYEQPLVHGGWFPDYGMHLLPKEGVYVTGFVHPQIHHSYQEKRFPSDAYIIHYPYRDWEHYFNKMNFYTSLFSRKAKSEGRSSSFFSIIFRPIWASFRMYILKRGFLDGRIGFLLAVFHFFYTMEKYVKLYYMDKSNSHITDKNS